MVPGSRPKGVITTVSTESDAEAPRRALPPMSHYARATAVVIAVAGLAGLAWATRGVLLLVFIGFLLAAGLDPMIKALERHVRRRGHAVLIVVLAGLIVVVLVVVLAIRPAITQTAEFITGIPELLDRLSRHFGNSSFAEFLASPDGQEKLRRAVEDVLSFATESLGVVVGILAGIVGAIFAAFTLLAITVYFMLALPRIKVFAGKAAGDEERVAVAAESLRRVGGYVTGQRGICACAGAAAGVFFLITGMPYAALLALIVAVLDAVPQVGATLGAIVAITVALSVSLSTAITVILAVLLGGAVGGFVGAIIALLIAATLKVIFRYVYRRELAAVEGRAVPEELAPAPPHRLVVICDAGGLRPRNARTDIRSDG